MKVTLIALTTIIGSAMALPQAATDDISPTGSAPAQCTGSVDGPFQIAIAPTGQSSSFKRDVFQKRSMCNNTGLLEITLNDNVLKDAADRTGYIASNYQFQFDDPPQAGAIYTAGFSLCDNSSLALGDSTVWYQCLSGDFYNLYSENWAEQCEPVELVALDCEGSNAPDDEPVLNTDVALPICQISDGQIQAHTTACVTVATATPQPGTTMAATTPVITTAQPSATVVMPSSSISPTSNVGYNATTTTRSALGTTQTSQIRPSPSFTGTVTGNGVAHALDGSSVVALAVGLVAALWAL